MAIFTKEEMKIELKILTDKVAGFGLSPHCFLCDNFIREVELRGVEDVIDHWGGNICSSEEGIMLKTFERYREITIDLRECEECNGKGFIELESKIISSSGIKENSGIDSYIVCSRCKGWKKLDWIERATEIKSRYRFSPDFIYKKTNKGKMLPIMRYEKI